MEYMTVQQVAKKLQLNVETIRRKIRSGKLPAYITGKSYRISNEQIKEFLEEETIKRQAN